MRSHPQHSTAAFPAGRVDVPGLLYGSIGLGLGVALQWMGACRRADGWLFGKLHEPLFHGEGVELPAMQLSILVAALFCYGVAFAVLDSAAMWRKIVLGITAVVLSLAMVPAFAVWGVYFSPFLQVVAVFWSWFCVVLYTQHHHMPCDPVHVEIEMTPPEPELLQPIEKTPHEPVTLPKKKSGKKSKKNQPAAGKTGSEDKYKPKS